MPAEKRVELLLAALQVFGQVMTMEQIDSAKKAVFEALDVELPPVPEDASPLEIVG